MRKSNAKAKPAMGKASRAVKSAPRPPLKPAAGKPAASGTPFKAAAKPAARGAAKPETKSADDAPVIALNLPAAKLSPAMAAYFRKCQDRLGFVPNVLAAYAFDNTKLETFVAMYNDLMLGESRLSKLEREMLAVAVSSQNRCY